MGRPKGSKNKSTEAIQDAVKVKKDLTTDVVTPTVKFVGDDKKHALQELFDGDEDKLPIITSVGTVGVPGTNTWISFVMQTRGTKVIKIEAEEPNLRAIAEESAKASFVNSFMGV